MGTRELQRRLDRLESRHSRKWYLWVNVAAGESDDDALRAAADAQGIRLEDIGYAELWHLEDQRPLVQTDFGGHSGKETLQGYVPFETVLRKVIAEENERKVADGAQAPCRRA